MNDTIIDTEFIFTSVPLVWFRTYHKILELLVCYGERKVINPNCKCSGSGNTIMECYELFQTAVAAYKLDKKEEGQNIVNHIDSLLRGYDSADSFTATIDGKIYLFTKDNIELIGSEEPDIPVVLLDNIYYGLITPASLDNWNKVQQYVDQELTTEVINALQTSRQLPLSINQSLEIDNTVKMFVVLVPTLYNLSVKKDMGFGGKIEFEGSYWYANGNATVIINNVEYKVYGQMYTTSGDITIYVN